MSKNHLVLKALGFLLVFSFLFSQFPGKGGLEGDQRDIPGMANRVDNWGFIVPFMIGNWPDIFGHWRYSLVFVQLLLLWLGLWLLLKECWQKNKHLRLMMLSFSVFASVFASQLWRDATLFSFATFACGLIAKSNSAKGYLRIAYFVSSVLLLHLAAMFKVLYGVILAVFFLWIFLKGQYRNRRRILFAITIASSLTFSPYLLDKTLSNVVGLEKTYPEQQPMIFDLASVFCWGTSSAIREDAAKGLSLVTRPGIPLQSICASLTPITWDTLHHSERQWIYSEPLRRIVGNNEEKILSLRSAWLSMIVSNPVDWVQVRMMYLGWTLTLSNSIVPQNETNTWSGKVGTANSKLWSMFFAYASLIDKARISSLLFGFLILSLLIVFSSLKSYGNLRVFLSRSSDYFIGYTILMMTTMITMIGFVASNGRYVTPYILMVYICILRSKA